jgi:hypothetical protein
MEKTRLGCGGQREGRYAEVHSRRAEVERHIDVVLNSQGSQDYHVVTEGTR